MSFSSLNRAEGTKYCVTLCILRLKKGSRPKGYLLLTGYILPSFNISGRCFAEYGHHIQKIFKRKISRSIVGEHLADSSLERILLEYEKKVNAELYPEKYSSFLRQVYVF